MGLVPSEVAFLCEMELVTIVPRQRLDPIPLLSGEIPLLKPPRRADVPLWLALLLKKQRRANIVPPPWLLPDALQAILHHETKVDPAAFSPPPPPPSVASGPGLASRPHIAGRLSAPFLPSNTAAAPSAYLPYHWLELAELLLTHAPDDVAPASSVGEVRALLKDIQEARGAKMRGSVLELGADGGAGGVMTLRGVGAMELVENRAFLTAVVDCVRSIGTSTETARREEEEDRERFGPRDADAYGDEDDNMEL